MSAIACLQELLSSFLSFALPTIEFRIAPMAYRSKVVLCLVPVALLLLFKEFGSEIGALGWHIGHGTTVRLTTNDRKAYALEAPLLYWPHVDELNWDATLVRASGPLRARLHNSDWAMISFSVAHQYKTAEELRSETSALTTKMGLVLKEVATVRVAGQDLHCFDRKWEKGRMSDLSFTFPIVDVTCVPLSDKDSFSASYNGTRKYLPTFYGVLQSVKRLN